MTADLRLAWIFARRELRGGIRGFRIFLACIALGVAAIAAVGVVRAAIEAGLREQGAIILGGDAQIELTYRFANPVERAAMAALALAVSEVVDFRSMAVTGPEGSEDRALTQVKAVDAAYPLLGTAVLDPAMPLAEAFAEKGGVPGAVMDRVLADRLGLQVGGTFRLGLQSFRLSAILVREPDSAGGFSLGPRTMVLTADLAQAGLLAPGTLYETEYRMTLPPGTDPDAAKAAAEAAMPDAGLRWQDSRRAAPGIERFVDRIGSFLVLVGLAGLAVGGVGVAASVRAYLESRVQVVATLRTLGAGRRLVFRVYALQIGVLTLLGVVLGLVLGAGLPMALAPLLEARLPMPLVIRPYPAPLLEAAFYGIVTAMLFTLWPLARIERVKAAALYRGGEGSTGWPAPRHLVTLGVLTALLIGGAALFSGVPGLALWSAAGVAGALGVLMAAAWGLRRLARRLARAPIVRGRPGLRLALAAIGGPGTEAGAVILSLGLGLSVLAAVGQIDANLRAAIDRDLPERAPSYFFLDIQNDQIDGFLSRLNGDPAVTRVESAPMLRGVLTQINGRPAAEVAGDHWVLRGDRGVTYAATPGSATVTAGAWWPEDYAGPPQVSFAAEEAAEMGLKLGDRITVNVLSRDIEAEVTSFRVVDFSSAGMGFVMTMNPAALKGAPHTYIATVYAEPEAEAPILRDLARAYPNITAIRVRDAIDRVTEALSAIAGATAWAAGVTLLTGFVVLLGAAAAGERARVREAAVLKVLGATRARILGSFALRSAITGAAAGLVAMAAGGLAGWAVMTFVMESAYRFEWLSALGIVAGGVAATLAAGLAFALGPLSARPAQVLRSAE